MAQKNYTIELRVVNIDDNAQFAAIQKAVGAAARALHARAFLIVGDGTPPILNIAVEDFRTGKTIIRLEDT